MRFPDSFIDALRNRVPISKLIGERVVWDKRKTNSARGDWWACCPFHLEKSSSFHCEDKKGLYHCFGCGASGDHYTFLTNLDRISFSEAVERIAAIAGISLPEPEKTDKHKSQRKNQLYTTMQLTCDFFQNELQKAQGAKARAYLRNRGVSGAIQALFKIGYAPANRYALKEFLLSKGIERSLIEACGLCIFESETLPYDRFRDRIMFPIEDSKNRIIAFGGRALSHLVNSKYLNSPETELFQKRNILYNFSQARKQVHTPNKTPEILVVEGYMDVITLSQAGFSNTVAPLGTSVTSEQIKALWAVSCEPLFCFDGDKAGLKASSKILNLILSQSHSGLSARFVLLPEGHDPDSFIRTQGKEAFQGFLEKALPLFDMLWLQETSQITLNTPEDWVRLEKRFETILSYIPDKTLRFHYMRAIRNRLGDLFRSSSVKTSPPKEKKETNYLSSRSRTYPSLETEKLIVSQHLKRSSLTKKSSNLSIPLREAAAIVTLIHHPFLLEEFFDEVERLIFSNQKLTNLLRLVLDAVIEDKAHNTQTLLALISKENLSLLWEKIYDQVRALGQWPSFPESSQEDARQAFLQILSLHTRRKTHEEDIDIFNEACSNEVNEEKFQSLVDVCSQFQDTQKIEALIEGFGVLSRKRKET